MTDLPYWTLHEAPPDSPKKWAVRVPTASGRGKVVLFGARGYEDFTTHHDVERRERYRTRHQRDRLDDPYAPGFWSMWALWGESDDLDTAFAAAVRKAKKLLEKNMARTPRKNPVREQFNFSHYEEYANRLTDSQLHHAIIDALDALKVARTWEDNGAGEAKYLDQLSVLRREQKSRGMRSNPRPLREDWLEKAREAGRNDAMNFGSAIAERRDYLAQAGWRELDEDDRKAMLHAWEQGVGEVRQNPEWARKVGGAVYRGTRKAAKYAKEVGTDLYHGAREAHRSHRDNPSGSVTHRLTGIGRLTITPDPAGARDRASVEVTKAFAAEWDHDMLNHAYLSRDVMAAAEEHREDSNFYAVALTYQGREFAKLYP